MRGATLAIASVGGNHGTVEGLARVAAVHGASIIDGSDAIADAKIVVLLCNLSPDDAGSDATTIASAAVQVARRFAGGGIEDRAFVVVQGSGGRFGRDGNTDRGWQGCFAGLARTAALEWPRTVVRLLDIASASSEEMAAAIHRELLEGADAPEVGLPGDGSRLVPIERPHPPSVRSAVALLADPVLLVTGGARGVTAACAIALARSTKCRLALIRRGEPVEDPIELHSCSTERDLVNALARTIQSRGDKVTPAALTSRARGILAAREAATTVAAIEAAGSHAMLLTADVADAADVTRAVDEARRAWGRIDGIVHGAGVLADRLIVDKTDEHVRAVFDAKVKGLRNLLDATKADALQTIILFSSVAGRYGNVGQADYAMANAGLASMALAEAARRKECLVRSIDWGAWDGGMVGDNLRAMFAARGVPLIDLAVGAQAFVDEIQSGAKGPEEICIALVPSQDRSNSLRSGRGQSIQTVPASE